MPRTETISKSAKCKIQWFIDDIEQIPAPNARARRWSDIFDSHPSGDGEASLSIGTKLRDAGLLDKTDDGRYRATEKLAEYMRDRHDVDIARPVLGLTTSDDSPPEPESELLVPPEDRPDSDAPATDSTTIHQSKLEEFADAPAGSSQGAQRGTTQAD